MSYLRKVRRGHSRFHCSWAKARSSDNASDCQCCHSSLLLGCSRCNLKDYSGAAAIVPTCHGGQNLNVARPWPALERFQHLNLGSSRSLSYRVEEEEQLEWPTKFGLDAIAQVWTWQRSLRNPAESLRMWWVTTRTMYLGSPPMMFSIGRKPQTWPSKDWFLYAVHWNHSTQLGQRHSNTSRMRLTEATKYNSVVVARCGMWSECRIVTCSSAWLRVTEYTLNIAKFKIIQYTPTSTMCIYMYIYTWSPPNKRKKRSCQWGSSNDITNWSILSTVQERCEYQHNMHLQCFGVQVCAQVKTKKEALFWNQHLVLKRLTPMIKIVNPLHENACDPSKSSTRSKQDKSPCAGLVGPNSQRT